MLVAMNRSPSGCSKRRHWEPSQRIIAVLHTGTWARRHCVNPPDQRTKWFPPQDSQMIGYSHANLTSNWEKDVVRPAKSRLGSQPPLHCWMDFHIHYDRCINIYSQDVAKSTAHQVTASCDLHDSFIIKGDIARRTQSKTQTGQPNRLTWKWRRNSNSHRQPLRLALT